MRRRKTREIKAGKVGIGGTNPVRIQSMTTSNTRDVQATIEQAIRLADRGCELVRVTVQGMKEAEACESIKNGLIQKGYDIPLVADIHFYPPAAIKVVDFVDKVRINPGNYVDKRAIFKTIEYDDASYAAEIEKIEEGFSPLVQKCKVLKRAMRIGTNHGSLSDRIMNRFGDTPRGMVESAIEFARVCRKLDYHNFLFSMKASNPLIMIQAYRLLVEEMDKLGWDYPLHLGVTEAGDGEDGRVKSAVGTGALLLDGIGDTIRVSLTEDPWEEIEPCKQLISFAESYRGNVLKLPRKENLRSVVIPENSFLHRDGSVFMHIKPHELLEKDFFTKIGFETPMLAADAIILDTMPTDKESLAVIEQLRTVISPMIIREEGDWEQLKEIKPPFVMLAPPDKRIERARAFFNWLKENNLNIPVLLHFEYSCSKEDLVIHASAECGALLADGLGEGICLKTPHDIASVRALSFNILQGSRKRTSKTEFIACPGCGRTLFDLQGVTKRIREKTSHLPGVKIAIMGCIVNGPGEMADADFGYVGSKTNKIDLYVGKSCVERNIDFLEADDRLIQLIKSHGRWINPE